MATTSKPIFAQAPFAAALSLATVSACVTRAPTATAALAAANIFELAPVSTDGRRIDRITVRACSTSITAASTAGLVGIWMWDGTNAYLIDEIAVSAVTPSATTAAFTVSKDYDLSFYPATFKLFASTTVATTASTNALQVVAYGGNY